MKSYSRKKSFPMYSKKSIKKSVKGKRSLHRLRKISLVEPFLLSRSLSRLITKTKTKSKSKSKSPKKLFKSLKSSRGRGRTHTMMLF